MKKVASRAIATLILVGIFIIGLSFYIVNLMSDGDKWVSFPVNSHAYYEGVLNRGTVLDRNGEVLASVADNKRIYSSDETTKRATLHVVGDREGNIGTGILSQYDTELMGYDFVNGAYSLSEKGNRVNLTLDAYVSSVAREALGYRNGAVVVYDYIKGDIVVMTSTPTFDPYQEIELDEDDDSGIYINRAISSTYTPGSVFKTVTLAAAIETIPDLFEMEFYCDGSVTVAGEEIKCAGVHGSIDINEALSYSCNVAFSEVSLILGGETIENYATRAGLLSSVEIGRIPTATGRFDIALDGSSDLAWSGIGQYNDLVNPTAMARFMGAVANGGTASNPGLVDSITTDSGVIAAIPENWDNVRLLNKSTADQIKEMMIDTAQNYYGTWRFPEGLVVGAKSGTAEVAKEDIPHSWFVGFCEDENMPYAFAVIVEHGGWGLDAAAGVASSVIDALYQQTY